MQVKHRDGTITPLDIGKIREMVSKYSDGLDINSLELEGHISALYTKDDIVTTQFIQQSLINESVRLVTVKKPDYKYLAARFLLDAYIGDTELDRGYTYEPSNLYWHISNGYGKGIYTSVVNKYSKQEIDEIAQFMNKDYDLLFDYAGANLLTRRYLIKNGSSKFELPQEMFLIISMILASDYNRLERIATVKKFYDAIASKKISLATPILTNLRKSGVSNLSSCFILSIDDNIDSIFYGVDSIAQISKNGGGVGVNLSRIRARGSTVKNTPNASSGVVPWIKIINDTAVAVNQLGNRAGACTVAIDVWHKDIFEFLELQTENGDLRKKAYDVFPQVVVPDLFMKRVRENGIWTLVDPFEIKKVLGVDIASAYGETFENVYNTIECHDGISKTVVSAKDIFIRIMKSQIETGMPYVFFKDTVNNVNPNKHDGYIPSGNLCVVGDTLITVCDFGVEKTITIKQLVNEFDADRYLVKSFNTHKREVEYKRIYDAFETSIVEEVYEIETESGRVVRCTGDHKIYTDNRGYVCAKDLVESDVLTTE